MPHAGIVVRSFDYKPKAARELKKLSPQDLAAVRGALTELQANAANPRLRLHKLHGYTPAIFVIDAVRDCSLQISFELDGDKAILRRIAIHHEIDRAP